MVVGGSVSLGAMTTGQRLQLLLTRMEEAFAAELRRTEVPPERRRTLAMRELAPYVEHQMGVWRTCSDGFDYTRAVGAAVPRADAWRPYRFAVQDNLLAVWALRHSKRLNAIEIDVFLTSDPFYEDKSDIPDGQERYPFEPLCACKALCLTVLSEAFRCGTPMRLRFTNNVERSEEERGAGVKVGRVPIGIMHLAEMLGTPMPDRESGALEPDHAIPLYAALTGFHPGLRAQLAELEGRGLLSAARACYLVHHGVWTVPELEGIVTACPYPELVLDGEVQPENRHLYSHVQYHARSALLGGVLDRVLLTPDPTAEPDGEPATEPVGRAEGASVTPGAAAGRDTEDEDRDLRIRFDPELGARRYRLERSEPGPLRLPDWRARSDTSEPAWGEGVPRGSEMVALLRPRTQSGLEAYLADDIAAAARLAGDTTKVAVVVPLDFGDLEPGHQAALLEQARQASVWLLVCPESTRTLDGYVRDKLTRSRVLPE